MRPARLALWAAILVCSEGCLLAAAGGAAAGIHLTSRGAEATVERPIGRMESAARQVFRDWGIELTGSSSENRDTERELEGEVEDLDVTVRLERDDAGTKIQVSARRNVASWDKDYAQRLLARIIAVAG